MKAFISKWDWLTTLILTGFIAFDNVYYIWDHEPVIAVVNALWIVWAGAQSAINSYQENN